MSAQPARHLHVVDGQFFDDNGEVVTREMADLLDELAKVKTDLKMAKRDVTAKNRKIAELEADKAWERENYDRRPDVERIHSYWQRKTGRRGALTPLRFDAVRGILEQMAVVRDEATGKLVKQPAYALEDFKTAIDGCAFDHYSKPRKNGSVQHFDDLEFICRDGKNFEECMRRAPRA